MQVLFITSSRIGDAVLSSGLLDYLIRTHDRLRITLACGPVAVPLFAETPKVIRRIPLAKKPWAGHWRALWRDAVRQRWDLVVDLRATALAYLVRARARRVYRPGDHGGHRVVQLSNFFGLPAPAPPTLWLGPRQTAAARRAVRGAAVLGLGPTANWAGKQWAPGKFAQIARRLTAPGGILPGANVAVFGAADERHAALPVLERIPSERRIDLVGRFDILTAAACLRECDLFVGNDSGLMHLAAAAGTPTLGLFGPSRDDLYAPWGDHCAVVRTQASYEALAARPFRRRSGSLMESLGVDTVEDAALALWRALPARAAAAGQAGR